MNNKTLFLDGYINRLSEQFKQSTDLRNNYDLAFEIFAIAVVLDKPFEEVFDTIIVRNKEGNNRKKDGGFDGIWFQDIGDYYIMHVFQCKNSNSLKANEIDKFRNDFRDIFIEGNKIGKENIDDLKSWMDEYKQISEQGFIIDAKLYYIFNGVKDDAQYANNRPIYDTYNNPDRSFSILDSDDLYNKIVNLTQQRRKEIKFTFHPQKSNISTLDSQGLYTYAIENIRAANFRIEALELCRLMDEEKKVNGSVELLFEENIRSFLGVKVRANKRMHDTINKREDSVFFPFLNNGITIICEELSIPKSPQNDMYLLPVKNPQVVNGLQTSWVLYENYKKKADLLKNVYVNVRIYETKEKDLITKITDATNTQTPINYRDKISNKDFNHFTKATFANQNINYITKRGENFSAKNSHFKEAIESETVIKYWYATFFEEPAIAKNSIASVLQNIYDASTLEKHPLESLFDGNKDSPIYIQFLTAYRIYRHVQEQKNERIKGNEVVAYADELVSYGIYKYIGNAHLEYFKDQSKLKEAYEDSLTTIQEIVSEETARLSSVNKQFSYNAYFKKPKCRDDFNKKKNIVENDALIEDLKNIR